MNVRLSFVAVLALLPALVPSLAFAVRTKSVTIYEEPDPATRTKISANRPPASRGPASVAPIGAKIPAPKSLRSPSSTPADVIAQLEKELKANPNQIAVREQLARKLHEAKNDKRAVEILAAYSNDASIEGLVLLAEIYDALKDYKSEIKILQMYQVKQPDRFRPYFLLGQAYARDKKPEEAIQNFRSSIQQAPKHLPSYQGILDISIEAKNHYEARTILAQMIRAFGPKPELLTTQCKLFADGGFLQEAEKACRTAIAKDNKIPENHVFLAQALLDSDRKQAAENVYRNAARQFMKSEYVQFAAGEYYFNEKNYPTAVRYLSNAVALKKDSARSQLGLALSLFESNRAAEALPHFGEACKLDKTRTAYNELRSATSRLRKTESAKVISAYDSKVISCQ